MRDEQVYRFVKTVAMSERERVLALTALEKAELIVHTASAVVRGIAKLKKGISFQPRTAQLNEAKLSGSV